MAFRDQSIDAFMQELSSKAPIPGGGRLRDIAGEVLDIDGKSGGYNLQAAFSTGYAAGINS